MSELLQSLDSGRGQELASNKRLIGMLKCEPAVTREMPVPRACLCAALPPASERLGTCNILDYAYVQLQCTRARPCYDTY